MNILGISAYFHDAAAALISDGKIIAAAQEERFTRKKNDAAFPTNAIQFCLDEAMLEWKDIDAVVYYEKPFLTFERLLETYYATAPKGLVSFIKAMPVWIKEKLFLKDVMKKALADLGMDKKLQIPLLFSNHHLSHAASAFYPSPFEEAAILTIDGVGEWATCSIAHGKGAEITTLKELHFPHSLGLLYSSFTYYLGFEVNNGEYKMMGLAPYAHRDDEMVKRFKQLIEQHLIQIAPDGSIHLHQPYFSYSYGLRMVPDAPWEKLFGFKRRLPSDEIKAEHTAMAQAIQWVTEEIILKLAATAMKICDTSNLCLAGGVALNCVANGKIKSQLTSELFIQPAAGDAGGALGAALAYYYAKTKNSQRPFTGNSCSGPAFSNKDIERAIKKNSLKFKILDNNSLSDCCADALANGKVIGWFQGKMEFGPRALGHRSILGDPRNSEMQKSLNLKVKFRESFRPFAPIVKADKANDYFEIKGTSPYMLEVYPILNKWRNKLPDNYHSLSMNEKLYTVKSQLPAITHCDFSARVQTVTADDHPLLYQLLDVFEQKTGFPVLVNTSFNVKDEPVVCSPDDAVNCYLKTGIDILVMGNYIVESKEN